MFSGQYSSLIHIHHGVNQNNYIIFKTLRYIVLKYFRLSENCMIQFHLLRESSKQLWEYDWHTCYLILLKQYTKLNDFYEITQVYYPWCYFRWYLYNLQLCDKVFIENNINWVQLEKKIALLTNPNPLLFLTSFSTIIAASVMVPNCSKCLLSSASVVW